MFYRFCWYLGLLSLKWIYRVKTVHKERLIQKGKCVSVCNHFSLMDVPMIGLSMYRQPFFISKKELYEKKSFSSWFFQKLGAIPIDRDTADIGAVKQCLKTLKDEKLLAVFPEGTRNKSGTTEVQEIKDGAALFAIKGKAPVMPMALAGKARPFHRNYVMIGTPFDFSSLYGKRLTPEDMAAAGEVVRQKMIETKRELDELIESKKSKRQKRGEAKAAGEVKP